MLVNYTSYHLHASAFPYDREADLDDTFQDACIGLEELVHIDLVVDTWPAEGKHTADAYRQEHHTY